MQIDPGFNVFPFKKEFTPRFILNVREFGSMDEIIEAITRDVHESASLFECEEIHSISPRKEKLPR